MARIASFVLVILAVAIAANAQGTIKGCIKDTAGAALPGVEVLAASGDIREVVHTDAIGCYEIKTLREGIYRVTATLNGFVPGKRESVRVEPGRASGPVDFALAIGPLAEICPVIASRGLFAAASPDKASEELNIREATYRYQFANNASGQRQRAGVYCLSVRDKDGKQTDLPTAFMTRFAVNKPPVKNFSECDWSKDVGVVDRMSGNKGLIFNTGDIKWVSDTEAEISGGYYEGGTSSSGNTYYARRFDGNWKIIKDVLHWIS